MRSRGRLQVLIADTDDRTREKLAMIVREEGYEAAELTKPHDVAEAVRYGGYHIVLLDMGHPSSRGVELLRQIREADENLCVICLTDEPSVDAAVATMKHRAFDYLEKPFTPDTVRRVLRAAVAETGLVLDMEERLNAEIGSRIRTRRHELGLTLKQVSSRTGLSVSLISQIELGKSAASVLTLYKVAAALDVPMASFFETL